MANVYLNIGSNIDREHNVCSCLLQLKQDYPDVVFSQIYETEAFGFVGDAFYNLAAKMQTTLSIDDFQKYLKGIEFKHGQQRGCAKFSSRALDIDLLLYDDLILQPDQDIPRGEILRHTFILFPLEEIAGDVIHPELRKTISDIARQSQLKRSELKLVDVSFFCEFN